ncbi:hypothetical protein IKD67_01700 [Candidatus Saccharibacteria bacterium]|nr:hypothetical protein [Candidatus Saccharibacteria bacterium]
MPEIIKVKQNKGERVIVKILGNDYDVTEKLVDGIATLNLYGAVYEIHVIQAKPKKIEVKKAKQKAEEVKVGFIETPEEG